MSDDPAAVLIALMLGAALNGGPKNAIDRTKAQDYLKSWANNRLELFEANGRNYDVLPKEAPFTPEQTQACNKAEAFVGISANGVFLARADLRGHNFRSGNWDANINTKLRNADFTQADLSGANLSYVSFDNAKFQGANLKGANLTEAYLANADLSDVDFTGANVEDAWFPLSVLLNPTFKTVQNRDEALYTTPEGAIVMQVAWNDKDQPVIDDGLLAKYWWASAPGWYGSEQGHITFGETEVWKQLQAQQQLSAPSPDAPQLKPF